MHLLDHVSITVRNLSAVLPFYKATMSALGAVIAYEDKDAIGFGERNGPQNSGHSYVSVFQSEHASADPRRHWCFRASSVDQVDAFHVAGLAAGGHEEGKHASGRLDHGTYPDETHFPRGSL